MGVQFYIQLVLFLTQHQISREIIPQYANQISKKIVPFYVMLMNGVEHSICLMNSIDHSHDHDAYSIYAHDVYYICGAYYIYGHDVYCICDFDHDLSICIYSDHVLDYNDGYFVHYNILDHMPDLFRELQRPLYLTEQLIRTA